MVRSWVGPRDKVVLVNERRGRRDSQYRSHLMMRGLVQSQRATKAVTIASIRSRRSGPQLAVFLWRCLLMVDALEARRGEVGSQMLCHPLPDHPLLMRSPILDLRGMAAALAVHREAGVGRTRRRHHQVKLRLIRKGSHDRRIVQADPAGLGEDQMQRRVPQLSPATASLMHSQGSHVQVAQPGAGGGRIRCPARQQHRLCRHRHHLAPWTVLVEQAGQDDGPTGRRPSRPRLSRLSLTRSRSSDALEELPGQGGDRSIHRALHQHRHHRPRKASRLCRSVQPRLRGPWGDAAGKMHHLGHQVPRNLRLPIPSRNFHEHLGADAAGTAAEHHPELQLPPLIFHDPPRKKL